MSPRRINGVAPSVPRILSKADVSRVVARHAIVESRVNRGVVMGKRDITVALRRSVVMRSTKSSARLERREVPAGHVRSAKVQEFVSALRAKA